MKRRYLVLVAGLILAACGHDASITNTATPTGGPVAAPVAVLLARPLRLPAADAGEACPVTPVASVSAGVTDPRGHGPFYLGGPMPKGGTPWNKIVYAVSGNPPASPVLLRGGRVGGGGRLLFSGQPAMASDRGTRLTSTGGLSAIFYDRVLGGSSGDALYIYPSTKGCYAIQADGATFQDVVVINAS